VEQRACHAFLCPPHIGDGLVAVELKVKGFTTPAWSAHHQDDLHAAIAEVLGVQETAVYTVKARADNGPSPFVRVIAKVRLSPTKDSSSTLRSRAEGIRSTFSSASFSMQLARVLRERSVGARNLNAFDWAWLSPSGSDVEVRGSIVTEHSPAQERFTSSLVSIPGRGDISEKDKEPRKSPSPASKAPQRLSSDSDPNQPTVLIVVPDVLGLLNSERLRSGRLYVFLANATYALILVTLICCLFSLCVSVFSRNDTDRITQRIARKIAADRNRMRKNALRRS
jgi:hypothetical protein